MNDPIGFPVPPVVKQVKVALSPQEAFDRFTEKMSSWWPLATLSLSRNEASACWIEGFKGGGIFERDPNGLEHLWGRVRVWSPPTELVLEWHPGRPEGEAQTVHVTFESDRSGTTLVTLVHSGWEQLGDQAREVRRAYQDGWEMAFVEAYARGVQTGGGDET